MIHIVKNADHYFSEPEPAYLNHPVLFNHIPKPKDNQFIIIRVWEKTANAHILGPGNCDIYLFMCIFGNQSVVKVISHSHITQVI